MYKLNKFAEMENKKLTSKNAPSCQLDIFEHSEPNVIQHFICPASAKTFEFKGVVIDMASHRANQQVQKFYEEVYKLTAHLER